MNLLLVTHYYATHRGGVEILADIIARGLAERHGVNVTWAAGSCDAPCDPPLRAEPIPVCNVTEFTLGFPYPIWWNPLSYARLWKLVGAHDAVHIHDFLYHGNVLAFLVAKLRGRPVLVTQHLSLVPYKNPILRHGMSLANAILGNIVLKNADRIIIYSEQVRAYFAHLRYRHQKPELVPNGVDTDLFAPAANDEERLRLRDELGLPRDKAILLFVGRFVEKKGLRILERIAKATDAELVMCGWGPIEPESWSLPNVRVVRGKKSSELAAYYKAADLLVLPSVGEGFPVVVQEAMASGLPAMVSTITADAQPAVKDAVYHDAVTGELDADGEAFTRRVRSLLDDPTGLRERRGIVAEVARREWSWPRCIERYAAALRSMVEERRR